MGKVKQFRPAWDNQGSVLFFWGQVPPWLVHFNSGTGFWLSACLVSPPCCWTWGLCLDGLLLRGVLLEAPE